MNRLPIRVKFRVRVRHGVRVRVRLMAGVRVRLMAGAGLRVSLRRWAAFPLVDSPHANPPLGLRSSGGDV